MLDQIVYWIGAAVCIAGGVALVAYAVFGCCALVNRTVRHVLESYGGMKVFLEYLEWYHANNKGNP